MSEESAGLLMAKWAVDRGALVIPAYIDRNCEKRPLLREWQNNGSREVEQLERWWSADGGKPWANVGVLGGRNSWVVFDCDGASAVQRFRSICERVSGIDWESVFLYRTPGRKEVDGTGGGLHAMFLWPDWLADIHKAEIREVGWSGGLEFRGRGTWTLLPCKRADGEYEVLCAPDKIAELPRELWLAFAAEAEQQLVGGGDSGDLREVSPEQAFGAVWTDGRKQAVAGLIWHQLLRSGGDWDDQVLEMALRFGAEACSPPLDEGIVRRKFEYTLRRIEGIRARQQAELGRWSNSINKLFG